MDDLALITSYPESFEPVGRCIYCGASADLTREHIVPYALGGRLVLPDASCLTCADRTKKFEFDCARTMFQNMRVQLGFPTRRKRERPVATRVDLWTEDKSARTRQDVAFSELPRLPIMLPILAYPSILSNAEPPEIIQAEMRFFHLEDPDAYRTSFAPLVGAPHTMASIRYTFPHHSFTRLLAKIAYGLAVGILGYRTFPAPITEKILGEGDKMGRVVGRALQKLNAPRNPEALWHSELGIYDRGDQRFLTVATELFLFLEQFPAFVGQVPTYLVVIGPADDELCDRVLGRPTRHPTIVTFDTEDSLP